MSDTATSTSSRLSLELIQRKRTEEVFIKKQIKKLSAWFQTWHPWQRRIFICHMMRYCSKQQLSLLATSLEPTLHLDFSNSLLPPLQSLYLDGVATFRVRRGVTQKKIKTNIVEKVDSLAYLNSLPTTFLSKPSTLIDSTSSKTLTSDEFFISAFGELPLGPIGSSTDTDSQSNIPKIPRTPILPALPVIHHRHLNPPRDSQTFSFNDISDTRRLKFSAIPEFRSTEGILKKARQRKNVESKRMSRMRKTISAYSFRIGEHTAEDFKEQLAQVSSWMEKWESAQKSCLLVELIKLCNENLLGYFVQCLYQQIEDQLNINYLPESILTHIFSYLSPKELSKCTQVCKLWNLCSNNPDLWLRHTYQLGMREGVGNVTDMIESVVSHYRHSLSSVGQEGKALVDWKRAFRDLQGVVMRMKEIIIKKADATKEDEIVNRFTSGSKSAVRNNLTLQEMLAILRVKYDSPNATTFELLRMAPESAMSMRRRLRAERRTTEELEKLAKSMDVKCLLESSGTWEVWSPSHNLAYAKQLIEILRKNATRRDDGGNVVLTTEEIEWLRQIHKMKILERVKEAVDTRPTFPCLPDPESIKCLILAGCLLSGHIPRAGRIESIPKIQRLDRVNSVILCMQCDSRKIVIGNYDQTIQVIDIRSGRPVSTLRGHKGSVQCLQFDDYKIVSGSWDTSCIIWDVVHFTIIKELNGHVDCVTCLQFDEDILVTGSLDNSLRVWSTSTWDTLAIINRAHSDGITCLKFNAKIIASGGNDRCVRIWSTSTYHCISTLLHNAPLSTLHLSHILLITCSMEGGIVFWNMHSHVPVQKRTLRNGVYLVQLVQHRTKYYGAGSNGLVYELDVSTGTCVRTLEGHTRTVTALCIVEYKLVSAAADQTLVIWYFKKGAKKLEEEEKKGEKEDKEENSDLSSDVSVDLRFKYKIPQYFVDLPLRIEITNDFDGLITIK